MTDAKHAVRDGYMIEDPRPIHAKNPYSFYLPCQARLDAIAPEDFVKAIFVPDAEAPAERMWVQINAIHENVIEGTLMNTPNTSALPLEAGDMVQFERHHVIAIETERADDPEETNDNERFFARCLVDARINDGAPIARIVRDEPAPDDYHGKGMFEWSGWRFEADGYQKGMDVETYALVVPLRSELGYQDMLDAPEGTVIIRDGAGGWRIDGPLN